VINTVPMGREHYQQHAGKDTECTTERHAGAGAMDDVGLLQKVGFGQFAQRQVATRQAMDMADFDTGQQQIAQGLLGARHVGQHEIQSPSHSHLHICSCAVASART
jgi:hypothetical protein